MKAERSRHVVTSSLWNLIKREDCDLKRVHTEEAWRTMRQIAGKAGGTMQAERGARRGLFGFVLYLIQKVNTMMSSGGTEETFEASTSRVGETPSGPY
jgi:hypothetical protein